MGYEEVKTEQSTAQVEDLLALTMHEGESVKAFKSRFDLIDEEVKHKCITWLFRANHVVVKLIPDAVAVKVTVRGTNFIFASLYMDITQPVTSNIFTELSSMANENTRVYICADTNSHHVLWGNKNTNSRGEELLDLLNT